MQKKKNRVRIILIVCFVAFLLTTNNGMAQEPVAKTTTGAELKHLWKKNEVLIGVGTAMLLTLIVYALWRRKKSNTSNIDSIT
ncbi:hypothetical protein FRZ67_08895 [Panacibacter ginsenosidivorans]|uniref:LPXTG cell wall anchor domain-containing protein n=1 Tax=Panacibacter ginsenosidivorans TaxID=1813871 RepID=A0A5B8V7F3_9BACT|nr:hypothetical protein [Panacibacter ginsenosidivorans]QEC67407.1 hypothetical protein FRZ67_08895 [Panacibacter ginsenosidivorans]